MRRKSVLIFKMALIFFSFKHSCQLTSVIKNNDFETGLLGEWKLDESLPGVNDIYWKVEDISENINPPVPHIPGNLKYLRTSRSTPGISYGLTAIQSSYVTVKRGDKFMFDYWLKSRYHGFNNILVYWINEAGKAELLSNASLWNDSSNQNDSWNTFEADIPVKSDFVELISMFVIYGVCGPLVEDAVAIDNIAIITESVSTTTEINAKSCPESVTGMYNGYTFIMPCWELVTGSCYCFSPILDVNGKLEPTIPQLTQRQADITCKTVTDFALTLLSIESERENTAIKNHLLNENIGGLADMYWTSGVFDDVDSVWKWGSTGESFGGFLDWATGSPQPNPDSYTCVVLNVDPSIPNAGAWKDRAGDNLGPSFICEGIKDSK